MGLGLSPGGGREPVTVVCMLYAGGGTTGDETPTLGQGGGERSVAVASWTR